MCSDMSFNGSFNYKLICDVKSNYISLIKPLNSLLSHVNVLYMKNTLKVKYIVLYCIVITKYVFWKLIIICEFNNLEQSYKYLYYLLNRLPGHLFASLISPSIDQHFLCCHINKSFSAKNQFFFFVVYIRDLMNSFVATIIITRLMNIYFYTLTSRVNRIL